MNKDKLRSIISKKAKGNNTLSGQLYQMFFFEKILERISKSKYKHNIILKGGLLLSSIIGNDERTTKDMDATLKSIPLEKEHIESVFKDILSIDLDDNITFEILDIKDIRQEDEYGGFKVNIMASMDNLRIHLAIETTTGDKITPREIEYNSVPCYEITMESTYDTKRLERIFTASGKNWNVDGQKIIANQTMKRVFIIGKEDKIIRAVYSFNKDGILKYGIDMGDVVIKENDAELFATPSNLLGKFLTPQILIMKYKDK